MRPRSGSIASSASSRKAYASSTTGARAASSGTASRWDCCSDSRGVRLFELLLCFICHSPLLLRGTASHRGGALGPFGLLLCLCRLGLELPSPIPELAPPSLSLLLLAPPLGKLVPTACSSPPWRICELQAGESVEAGGLHVPAEPSGLERGTTCIADGGRAQGRRDPVEARAARRPRRVLEDLLRFVSQGPDRPALFLLRPSQRVSCVPSAL